MVLYVVVVRIILHLIYVVSKQAIRIKNKDINKEYLDDLINTDSGLKIIRYIENDIFEFYFKKNNRDYYIFYSFADKRMMIYENDGESNNPVFNGIVDSIYEAKVVFKQVGI